MIVKWVTGLLAIGALVGVTVASAGLPEPAPAAASRVVVKVTPAVLPVACPGPLSIPVGDIDSADDALDSGSRDRTYATYGPVTAQPLDDGVSFDAPVGSSLERVGSGDIAGLAGVECVWPMRDQWIVGGSTRLGSSSRLVLSNPGTASVEVTVTLHGPVGPIEEQAILAVGPGRQRVVLLEGIEAEVPGVVVHVEATGAGIAAAVQDSRLDGFQPAGSDWVVAAVPAERVVIPAVGLAEALVVPPEPGTETPSGIDTGGIELPESTGGEIDLSVTGVLRLLAPDGATASLTLVTENGIRQWQGTAALDLEAGVATDVEVPLDGLMGIEIEADGPVVAAAMTRVPRPPTEGSSGSVAADLSWVAAQPAGDEEVLVVPEGAAELVAYSRNNGELTVVTNDGVPIVTEVVAGRTLIRVPLTVDPGTVLTARGADAWVVRMTDQPGFITAIAPRPTTVTDLEIPVGPGTYASVP